MSYDIRCDPKTNVDPKTNEIITRHVDDNGHLHCDHGPAILVGDNFKAWYQHGLRHRLDGPAVITSGPEDDFTGVNRWMVHGWDITEDVNDCRIKGNRITSDLLESIAVQYKLTKS